MTIFVNFNNNGVITSYRSAPADLVSLNVYNGDSQLIYDSAIFPNRNYYIPDVSNPTLTQKLSFTTLSSLNADELLSNGIDTVTFGNSLPNPTTVSIFSSLTTEEVKPFKLEVTDGSLELTSNVEAELTVTLKALHYEDYTLTVNAYNEIRVGSAVNTITMLDVDVYPLIIPIDKSFSVISMLPVTIMEV